MPYRSLRNVILACLAAPALAWTGATAHAEQIELVLAGTATGAVHAALLPITGQQWEAPPLQTLRSPGPLRFSGVPPGDYAVQLFVDSNGNGILDRSPRGLPREPVGFSNNPSLLKGAPDIGAARFHYSGEALTLNIRLRQSQRSGGQARGEAIR